MADPRFFNRAGPFSVEKLTEIGDAQPVNEHKDLMISDVGTLDSATDGMISFFTNPKYIEGFRNSKATACVVPPEAVDHAPKGMILLVSSNPYKSFAKISNLFYAPVQSDGVIHPAAIVNKSAVVGKNVSIGAFTMVEEGAVIGDNTVIGTHCFVGKNVRIGDGCRFFSHVSMRCCQIGDNVAMLAGARIGEDGFGFAPDPVFHVKIPQLGRVIIGSNVEIGSNTCIDRGAGPDTVIGDNCWLDNQVHIAHNVKLGRSVIIAGQSGISGSTIVEDYVAIGGHAGIGGHITIGMGSQITGMSGVISDVPKKAIYAGFPARPRREFFRSVATLRKLMKKKGSSK